MPPDEWVTRCRPQLGTFVEITVPADDPACADIGFEAIASVQAAMSFHDEASDLARLRRSTPGRAVVVDPATVEVLTFAADLRRESKGLFDVTVGAELARTGFLPRPAAAVGDPQGGSAADIEIVDGHHVICHRPLLIDLGGIAKGYAVDRATAALRAAGMAGGMVNAGGDLRVFGGRDWQVGLRDGDGAVRETITLVDQAAASSSNLHSRRRGFLRVHTPHIGRGRKPMKANGRMTVVAPDCMLADAMTKIAIADHALAQSILDKRGGYVMAQGMKEKSH